MVIEWNEAASSGRENASYEVFAKQTRSLLQPNESRDSVKEDGLLPGPPVLSNISTSNVSDGTQSENVCMHFKHQKSIISSAICELAAVDGYQDVIIRCDGHTLAAHRLVLSCASPFLFSIFQVGYFTESKYIVFFC